MRTKSYRNFLLLLARLWSPLSTKYFLLSLLTTLSVGTTALAATPDNQYESVEMVAYPIFMVPESSLAVELQDQQV